ncbi:MAG: hypothetical protein IKR86_09110 [Candidatus Methanomethylophilaceae archaeon]|nr:hypothetical protein [Candidatus Methanomethylophilaceae archaeon]
MTSIVTHYAYPRGGGVTVGIHIRRVSPQGDASEPFSTHVLLAPEEALEMADAIRDDLGRFRRESGTGAVEVFREPCESDEIIWMRADDEVRIPIDPRDGWRWDYAEDIGKAAREAVQ